MKLSYSFLALGVVLAPSFAMAEDAPKQKVVIGLSTGLYIPEDSRVRKALNSAQLQIPFPSPMNTQRFADRSFRFNLNLINGSNGNNRLFAPAFLFGYEQRLPSKDQSKFLPYFRVDAGVAYLDYALDIGAGRVAAKRLSPAGALELGVIFGSRLRASVTYNAFQKYDGINLSGLTLGVQVAVLRF